MSDFKRPKRQPSQRNHLERLITELSRDRGVDPGRLRRWVSTMVLLGALDGARDELAEPRFLLKGGVAIELRLGMRARATKDVDVVFRGDPGTLRDILEDTLAPGYPPFAFRLSQSQAIRDTGAERMEVKITFSGSAWATLQLEVSPAEAGGAELELVEAVRLDDLLLSGPKLVACQSLRYQIATKLHAVTERFPGKENDRVRDLADLILLRDIVPDLAETRKACVDIFQTRQKHEWPPTIEAERSWRAEYPALADRMDFPISDIDEAVAEVRAFIYEIDRAA